MAKVKVRVDTAVRGTQREIEIDFELHEPTGPAVPWFAAIGAKAEMTPEHFIQQMDDESSLWQFSTALVVERQNRDDITANSREANAFEQERRRLVGGRTGRPRQVIGFSQADDIAVVVLYLEALGHKQGIRKALEYWKLAAGSPPARRHIDEALRRVRRWTFPDLHGAANATRKRYGLPPLPSQKRGCRTVRRN